jgi:hypothetical protein
MLLDILSSLCSCLLDTSGCVIAYFFKVLENTNFGLAADISLLISFLAVLMLKNITLSVLMC